MIYGWAVSAGSKFLSWCSTSVCSGSANDEGMPFVACTFGHSFAIPQSMSSKLGGGVCRTSVAATVTTAYLQLQLPFITCNSRITQKVGKVVCNQGNAVLQPCSTSISLYLLIIHVFLLFFSGVLLIVSCPFSSDRALEKWDMKFSVDFVEIQKKNTASFWTPKRGVRRGLSLAMRTTLSAVCFTNFRNHSWKISDCGWVLVKVSIRQVF